MKGVAIGATSLALLGSGIGIGYGIFGRKEEPRAEKTYVKTLGELIGCLYEVESLEAFRGVNVEGRTTNILKISARGCDGIVNFSIYERDPRKFETLLCHAKQAKCTGNPFGLVDPLIVGGYPIAPEDKVSLRIERDANNMPVYILDARNLIFYTREER
ncbi:MAG: hypothetical protein QXJ96_03205 [Candidatus Aenigmatarchaeota archaeon]|nr:hypothetical protein [Candidatus Aenigmarchaeota archaeon]